MNRSHIPNWRMLPIVALALLSLGACSSGSITVNQGGTSTIGSINTPSISPTSTLGSSPTSGGNPTSTPVPQGGSTTCATLLPGGSSPASAGTGFSEVTFPTGTLTTMPVQHSAGIGLWSIYLLKACTPNFTVTGLESYFATNMLAQGFAYAPTLPFDGGYQASCGDPYCWSKNSAPKYLGLESVTDAGNGNATYTLRLFFPPPAPQCSPIISPYHSFDVTDSALPLPPLSVYEPGSGSVGVVSNEMCSAGDASTINTFYNKELPQFGWHQGTFHGVHEISPSQLGCASTTYSGWIDSAGKHAMSWNTNPSNFVNGASWNLIVYTNICP